MPFKKAPYRLFHSNKPRLIRCIILESVPVYCCTTTNVYIKNVSAGKVDIILNFYYNAIAHAFLFIFILFS